MPKWYSWFASDRFLPLPQAGEGWGEGHYRYSLTYGSFILNFYQLRAMALRLVWIPVIVFQGLYCSVVALPLGVQIAEYYARASIVYLAGSVVTFIRITRPARPVDCRVLASCGLIVQATFAPDHTVLNDASFEGPLICCSVGAFDGRPFGITSGASLLTAQ